MWLTITNKKLRLSRLRDSTLTHFGWLEVSTLRDYGPWQHFFLREWDPGGISPVSYSRAISVFPRTSHIFPSTSHIFPKTSHIFPSTSHIFPKTHHLANSKKSSTINRTLKIRRWGLEQSSQLNVKSVFHFDCWIPTATEKSCKKGQDMSHHSVHNLKWEITINLFPLKHLHKTIQEISSKLKQPFSTFGLDLNLLLHGHSVTGYCCD